MATDRLSNFKLGMGIVIKGIRTSAASGGLRLQCVTIATFSSFRILFCWPFFKNSVLFIY